MSTIVAMVGLRYAQIMQYSSYISSSVQRSNGRPDKTQTVGSLDTARTEDMQPTLGRGVFVTQRYSLSCVRTEDSSRLSKKKYNSCVSYCRSKGVWCVILVDTFIRDTYNGVIYKRKRGEAVRRIVSPKSTIARSRSFRDHTRCC